IEPLELAEKEGLALINGTDGMLGMLLMAIADLDQLVRTADVTTALTVQGLRGRDSVFRPELHEPLRPHPAQAASAANIHAPLHGSAILDDVAAEAAREPDPSHLRCAPRAPDGARGRLEHPRTPGPRALTAPIDNPVLLPEGTVTSFR